MMAEKNLNIEDVEVTEPVAGKIEFHDVSEQLNIYNSELGYMLPKYKTVSSVIEYKSVDLSKLDYYSKEMANLQAKFDNLVANSSKYNDGYAQVVIDEIKAEASQLAEVAEQELDAVFEDVKSNPRVIEAFDYSVDREANAINRNTAVVLIKSIVDTNDLSMIKGLLADNIANDDVRMLAKIKLIEMSNNKEGYQDRLPVSALLSGIEEYEINLKKQSELGALNHKHELAKGAFRIAKQSNKYLAKLTDIHDENFKVETLEFSMSKYKQEKNKAKNPFIK